MPKMDAEFEEHIKSQLGSDYCDSCGEGIGPFDVGYIKSVRKTSIELCQDCNTIYEKLDTKFDSEHDTPDYWRERILKKLKEYREGLENKS